MNKEAMMEQLGALWAWIVANTNVFTIAGMYMFIMSIYTLSQYGRNPFEKLLFALGMAFGFYFVFIGTHQGGY